MLKKQYETPVIEKKDFTFEKDILDSQSFEHKGEIIDNTDDGQL